MLLTLPDLPPATARLGAIPDGVPGVRVTLRTMARLARDGKLVVRPVALQLTQHLAQRDRPAEVRALHEFVRDRIRYVRDPRAVETLQAPERTLQIKAGDCDDKAILLAALLESIGHPSRFHAIGFAQDNFSHVYVETKLGARWLPLETTEDWDPGRAAPRAVSHMLFHL